MKAGCAFTLMLVCAFAQANATDDYLAGLRALQQGDGEQALYLLEQAANAGLMDAQWRQLALIFAKRIFAAKRRWGLPQP